MDDVSVEDQHKRLLADLDAEDKVQADRQRLVFRASDHSYRVGDTELISVTTVLKEAGLIDTTWFTDESRLRGTTVAIATKLAEESDLDLDKLNDDCRGPVDAWERFKVETGFVVAHAEYGAFNRQLGLACRIDRLGCFTSTTVGQGTWILELKTGTAAAWHWLQLAGQSECVDGVCQVGVVYLKPDGGYTFYRREFGQHLRDRQTFKAALKMVHWKRENMNG